MLSFPVVIMLIVLIVASATGSIGGEAGLAAAMMIVVVLVVALAIAHFVLCIMVAIGAAKLENRVPFILILVGFFVRIIDIVGLILYIIELNKQINKKSTTKTAE